MSEGKFSYLSDKDLRLEIAKTERFFDELPDIAQFDLTWYKQRLRALQAEIIYREKIARIEND